MAQKSRSKLSETVLLGALHTTAAIEPAGALLPVRLVRRAAGLSKSDFDDAALELARQRKVVLHHHDLPSSLTRDELEGLVHDRATGYYYVGIALPPEPEPQSQRIAAREPSLPSRLLDAFDRLDREQGGRNYVTLLRLRESLGVSRQEFDAAINSLRRARVLTLDAADQRHERMSPEELDAAIIEDGSRLVYAARRAKEEQAMPPIPPVRPTLGPIGRTKAATVMREFHHGVLHSGSGGKVTKEPQAKAIAISEARKAEREKRSTGAKRAAKTRLVLPRTVESQWDKLWRAYVEATLSGNMRKVFVAGKSLIRFDRVHGASLPAIAEQMREATAMLAHVRAAHEQARAFDRSLEQAKKMFAGRRTGKGRHNR